MYFESIIGKKSYCDSHVLSLSPLAGDLKSVATTPNYSFVTPNTCLDGHDWPKCQDGTLRLPPTLPYSASSTWVTPSSHSFTRSAPTSTRSRAAEVSRSRRRRLSPPPRDLVEPRVCRCASGARDGPGADHTSDLRFTGFHRIEFDVWTRGDIAARYDRHGDARPRFRTFSTSAAGRSARPWRIRRSLRPPRRGHEIACRRLWFEYRIAGESRRS